MDMCNDVRQQVGESGNGALALRPGFWMTGTAWLDNDGRHIWFAHDCLTERVVTMLPWPRWHSDGLNVVPSISCKACGLHANYSCDFGGGPDGQG